MLDVESLETIERFTVMFNGLNTPLMPEVLELVPKFRKIIMDHYRGLFNSPEGNYPVGACRIIIKCERLGLPKDFVQKMINDFEDEFDESYYCRKNEIS